MTNKSNKVSIIVRENKKKTNFNFILNPSDMRKQKWKRTWSCFIEGGESAYNWNTEPDEKKAHINKECSFPSLH